VEYLKIFSAQTGGIVVKGQIAEPMYELQIKTESILLSPGVCVMLFLYIFHVATVGLLMVSVPYPYISAFLVFTELYGSWLEAGPTPTHLLPSVDIGNMSNCEGTVSNYTENKKI
jgi:hypothetical protein